MAMLSIQNFAYCARLRDRREVTTMKHRPMLHAIAMIIAAVALIVLAATVGRLKHSPERVLQALTATKFDQAPSSPGGQATAAVQSVKTSPVSPPSQDLTALFLRADGGDRKAACLLGFKLLRCARVHMIANDTRLMDEAIPLDLDAANRKQLLQARTAARALVALCQGAPPDSKWLGFQYVRQAALAGEAEAMYRYARGDVTMMEPWDPDSRQFALWTEEADEMLLGAFRKGYTPAVVTLWEAYVDDHSPISQLIPDDRLKAQALEFLMMGLRGESVDMTSNPIRYPDLAIPAAAQALKWQRAYFAKTPIGKDAVFELPYANLGNIFADQTSRNSREYVATCSQ